MKTAILAPGTVESTVLLAPVVHEPFNADPNALAGMAMVRRFGMADMYDRDQVVKLVAALGFKEGADWLRANRHLYFLALQKVVGVNTTSREREIGA